MALGGLLQSVIDNFDVIINTPNGKKQTHDLAIIHTQHGTETTRPTQPAIPRILKRELKSVAIPDRQFLLYKGCKSAAMPKSVSKLTVLPLKVLAQQAISVSNAKKN